MAVVVVTGANRGIGLEFVKQYLAKGDEVYALCRVSNDELNNTGAQVVEGVDVSNQQSLEEAFPALHDVKIDLLINNAGVLSDETLKDLSIANIEYQFRVNAIGPLLVSQMLRKQLGKGAKIALITSRMGSVADNTSGGRYGYRMSKAALNIAGMSLAHDLKAQEVAVALLHPGYVQTEMVNNNGDISAAVSVSRLIQRIDALNMTNTGTFGIQMVMYCLGNNMLPFRVNFQCSSVLSVIVGTYLFFSFSPVFTGFYRYSFVELSTS